MPQASLLAAASGTAFSTIVLGQLANAFACRSEHRAVGSWSLRGNRLLLWAVASELVLLAVFLAVPPVAGVLGHADSARYESFGEGDDPSEATAPDGSPRATHGAGGLLDYPHFTRPAVFQGTSVPEVLQAGDHQAVRKWRRRAALQRTLQYRPDLLDKAVLTREDLRIIEDLRKSS